MSHAKRVTRDNRKNPEYKFQPRSQALSSASLVVEEEDPDHGIGKKRNWYKRLENTMMQG